MVWKMMKQRLQAADDSVLVTATTEAKMEAIEEAVGRKRQ